MQQHSMYARSQEFYHMEHTFVIAGYVRNSDPAKKDSEVLNSQKEAVRAYAREHYNADIPDYLMYEDAISALKYPYWEREGLMQAWDDAENKRFDKLLVTEFFRIARKSAELAAVMEYFKRFGVEVISITEKFEDSAEGRLLHAVQGFLGEIEAEKTRIRTSRGKRHRAGMVLLGQGHRTYGLKFVDNEHYHHSVGISVAILDAQVWEFARPYILNPVLVREHIDLVRGQVDPKNRRDALEASLQETKTRIVNLLSVAEAATDEITRQLYRERLVALEKDLRETELLLTRFSNTTERSQKLLTALDKFEAWAISQQPYLRDPTYEITKEDKRAALLILGVTATVWPTEGYPDRVKFALSPPDIQRFCDFNFQ